MIHLWSRRQAVTVDFSSLMFLVAAHRQNVRRLQLKQFLILLLRMLIIALIALALARPFLTLGLPLASVRSKTAVVIVLDNSYSMGYQDVDGIWFDKAKSLATDVLGSLRHGDSASLVLMSDIARPVYQQVTPDIEDVIKTIEEAEVSYRGTRVQPSIELAHEILLDSQGQNKELYLISDFRQNGWENVGVIPNASASQIVLLPVSQMSTHNTNIEEILPSHQLIGIDLPFQFNVGVKNHSDSALSQTTLTFYEVEEKKQSHTFGAESDELVMTTLTHTFNSPGIHTGYFELSSDRLNVDNRRYYAIEVLGEIRVLCVGEQTDYLKLALNPLQRSTAVNAPLESSMIQPTSCTPKEFETFPLEEFDLIILVDIESITSPIASQLNDFIREGKSIIAFASNNYNLSWVPVHYGQSTGWQTPQHVSKYDSEHPIFDIFPENVLSGQYGPKFYEAVEAIPAKDANVIASYSDDTPFLIERREGKSQILYFNTGFDVESGDNELLVNPYFLPLIQSTVLYTMYSDTPRNITVGDPLIANFPNRTGVPAWIKRVDAPDENDMVAVPISEEGMMRFDDTELPGIYQVDMKTQDRLFRSFFAVNTPTSEADLEPFSLQVAAEKVNAEEGTTDQTGQLDTEALDTRRHGREIWGELLLFAVCLLLIEGFLSNRQSDQSSS